MMINSKLYTYKIYTLYWPSWQIQIQCRLVECFYILVLKTTDFHQHYFLCVWIWPNTWETQKIVSSFHGRKQSEDNALQTRPHCFYQLGSTCTGDPVCLLFFRIFFVHIFVSKRRYPMLCTWKRLYDTQSSRNHLASMSGWYGLPVIWPVITPTVISL